MAPNDQNQSQGKARKATIWLSVILVIVLGSIWIVGRNVTTNQMDDCLTNADVAKVRGLSPDLIDKLHDTRGLTNPEICAMPAEKLDRAIVKAGNPKPDHPGEAVEYRLESLRDEFGNIPADGYSRAAEHINWMQDFSNSQGSPLDPATWSWLGPGNIGGRVRSIVIHPSNPSTMWAGAVSGGIWKTTDSGASWQPEDDFMANLAVSTMVMDPNDSNTIYAGTGEGFYNADAIRGAGVFKTIDGGANWTQLASTANSDWYYVNRLVISPDGTTILAATRTGIYLSTDAGASWSRSIYANAADVNFDPADNDKAVAGGRVSGETWFSIDGGATWSAATYNPALVSPGRVEVAYAPSNPSIVYASVDKNNGEIWKSTDGGQNYSLVNTGNSFLGSQGWYDNVIWVDPSDPNTLIVGGIDLWRSTDGGSTITKISQWWSAPASAHADHHAIVEHPNFDGTSNNTVYFGNDGGVYRADNVYTVAGISGWQELNNNLGITQFYGAAGNSTSGIIIGGTQDNGTLRYIGDTETWDSMYGGDGGWCAADPDDPNYFYGEYVYLMLHRSTNGGASSSYFYSGITDAGNCANFISPFILDPNDPNTMLAGGCSLWRSSNVKAATPTWSAIKPAIGSNISAVAVALGSSDLIWIGHNNGDVYMTSNGTNTSPSWTKMDANSPNLPNRKVMRITIDPVDHDIVYVSFGGFSPDNIWRTSDGGATWIDVTGSGATGLPDAPVRSVVINPLLPAHIYAGTEVGIFASEDRGETWWLPQDGPANVSVDELFWMNMNLVAATHGRGLYRMDLSGSYEFPPGSFSKLQPPDGATGQNPGMSIISWQASSGAADYEYCYDTSDDDSCSNWVSNGIETSAALSLDPLTTYYWHVRANNANGTTYAGDSSTDFWSFTTGEPVAILLVDDDDNSPDVRGYYTDILDALGLTYQVWDTNNTDDEPDAAFLSAFEKVVWFTGVSYGGYTGPGSAAEGALGEWLDSSGCLFISSQDYLFDRGLTSFMSNYLGVESFANDVGTYASVSGQGSIYGSLGTYALSYPFSNFADVITPTLTTELAFLGSNNDFAAINYLNEIYETTFLAFPLESIASEPERSEVLSAFLNSCETIDGSHVQHIPLGAGWNMVSSYIAANDPILETLISPIESNMLLMKNGAGEVYWPAMGFNDIGSWDVREGYQIFMNDPDTLSIAGTKVDPAQTPISLDSGWSLVSYLLAFPKPIDQALLSITDELYLAKNGFGELYWPTYDINQISNMQPGEGYKVYLQTPGILDYAAQPGVSYVVSTSAEDSMCDTGFGGYVNLEDYGIFTQSAVTGDSVAFGFFASGDPIDFYGNQYESMYIADDGYAIFDPINNYGGDISAPQLIPSSDLPNNLAAMLWQDMEFVYDSATNKGVSAATAGANVMLVEYDDIQIYGDAQNTYDFEIIMTRTVDDTPGAYEIIFAYDNLNGTLANALTVGVENSGGQEATALVNQSSAEGAISNGLMVCFDAVMTGAVPPRTRPFPPPREGVELSTLLVNEPLGEIITHVNQGETQYGK